MQKKVLITGANGLLANKLGELLKDHNYYVCYLSTKKSKATNIFYWNLSQKHIDEEALIDTDYIIHLAGYSISNIWTKKNKIKMFDSRVKTSQLIYEKCKILNQSPKLFISASAMGFYGLKTHGLKREEDNPVENDWMSSLCVEWEKQADKFKDLGSRVIKLRLSLIIDKNGGVLEKILLGNYFRIAFIFGDGNQPCPWIHSSDVAKFILHGINNTQIHGPINIATDQQISFKDLIFAIEKNKNKKSIPIHLPKWFLITIMGEQSSMLFSNIILSVSKLKQYEFSCDYKTIDKAVQKEIG